jgi:D-alanyl-D-alanine carboxypeptidase
MFKSRQRVLATALAAVSVIAGPALVAPAQARPAAALYPAERSAEFAGIVMDEKTGEVLFEKNADAQRYPASISKVMTLYLAFEEMAAARLKPTDLITVSPHAAAQPRTNLGMHAGQTITVENALHGMAVHSANDMAMAVAEKIGGSQARFAEMMNRKAQQLGMTHSHFDNPNGLPDPSQVSSARDIAILCRALVRDFPQYYSLFDTRSFTYRGRTMRNTNHLLGVVPGVDGIKTGFTNAAGHNIAISGVRDGRRMIVVVLGAPSGPSRDVTARDLLTSGFQLAAREHPGVQLAQAAPAPEAPARKAEVEKTRTEAPPAREAHVEAARWNVLVGGFRARPQAQRFATLIEHRYRREFRGLRPEVVGRGPFRVEFARLDERQAKSACETLSASGHRCSRVSTGA